MITLNALIDSFSLNFTPSSETDISYYKVHAVHSIDLVNGDFTPSDDNLINEGPETSIVWKTSRNGVSPYNGTWNIKIAAVDTYGEDNLNYTPLHSVIVTGINSSQLPADNRVDFWVNSSIFNFSLSTPLTTMSWTSGTIVRDSTSYTLSSGSLTDADGCYIIATLNTVGYTVTISVAKISSGTPTLSSNQINIGSTSSTALTDGTYLAYIRQANSMMLEGAAIRDLTVTTLKLGEDSVSIPRSAVYNTPEQAHAYDHTQFTMDVTTEFVGKDFLVIANAVMLSDSAYARLMWCDLTITAPSGTYVGPVGNDGGISSPEGGSGTCFRMKVLNYSDGKATSYRTATFATHYRPLVAGTYTFRAIWDCTDVNNSDISRATWQRASLVALGTAR